MRIAIYLFFSLLFSYLLQAYGRWDILWISSMGTWRPEERIGLLVLYFVSLAFSFLIYEAKKNFKKELGL